MANETAPENGNDPGVQKMHDTISELQTRKTGWLICSQPKEEMMLAGAHNAGLRPLRQSITAGEAKNIFAAMVAAMTL